MRSNPARRRIRSLLRESVGAVRGRREPALREPRERVRYRRGPRLRGPVKPPRPRPCVHEQRPCVHDSFSNVARERMPRLFRRRRKSAIRRNARSYRRPSLRAPLKRNIGERIVQQARCLPLDPCRRAPPSESDGLRIGRDGAFPAAKGRSGASARFSRDGRPGLCLLRLAGGKMPGSNLCRLAAPSSQ